MKLERRSITVVILSLLLAAAMLPLYAGQAYAEEDPAKKAYNDVMQSNVPETFRDENYEPYGFGKEVPVMMNKQSEVLFYMMNKSEGSGDIATFYDKLKVGNTEDIFKGATKTDAMKTPPVDMRKAIYMQAVSFDPRGTGRDDHIAFLGVNSTKYACVWVYDTRNKKWYRTNGDNGGFRVVKCAWMESEELAEYEAKNFLSITAGDYDGDGKDTIVVYAAGDYVDSSTDRYKAYEIKVDSPAVGSSGSISLSETHSGSNFIYSYKYPNESDKQYRIGGDLTSGDIDGDGIDDLAVVTYYGDVDNSNQSAAFYRPYMCVMYGGRSNIFGKIGSKVGLWEAYDDESVDRVKNKNWDSIVSPGISAGDIDDDGRDEIVAAGMRNVIHANGAANAGQPEDIDKYNLGVYIFNDSKVTRRTVSANKWTTNGFYIDDKVWNKTAVECVAVNGLGNPEMVFISGTLYDVDRKNNVSPVETPGYFNSAGDNLSSKPSSNMHIQSTAAGNFDGNDRGYEQVAFTVSCKSGSRLDNDYLMGVIGGKNHDSISGIASGYYSTSDGSMDDDNSYPDRVDGSNRAGTISEDTGLNCIVVGVDSDNDGMLVRYKEKTFTYADPDIVCIIQDHIEGNGSTTYTIKNSYSFESSTTSSSSFGVGGVVKRGTPACEIEVQAGYAREFSQEFTEAYEEAESYTWTATTDDQVVVYRAPVISYKYQVQDPTGAWEKDGEDNTLIVSVPEDPSYVSMSINTYNLFADYYNAETAKKTSKFRKIQKLNNVWLGHEGDPAKYISASNKMFNQPNSGYELIQRSFQNVAHTSGSTGWSLEKGTSSSVTESLEYGFTFDASVGVGPDLGPVSFSVGVSTSLQNMSGNSTTESKATENGIECNVDNIDSSSIPAKLKPNQFSFSYKMATWPSGIKRYVKGSQTTPVPVYGYALAGVHDPFSQGELSPEELEVLDLKGILDTISDSSEITLFDEEDVKQARKLYDELSDEAKKLVDEEIIIKAEEKITVLKKFKLFVLDISGWEIILDKDTFTYNGKVQRPEVRSIWGLPLVAGKDYLLEWSDEESKEPGKYTVTAVGNTVLFTGSTTKTYEIEKAGNRLSVKSRTVKAKASALRKRAKAYKRSAYLTIGKYDGKLAYARVKGNSKITVNKKTGKLILKKGLKKGRYSVTFKVTAKGDKYHKPLSKKVAFKVIVK